MNIAKELKKTRENAGLSQQKMADMVGIPQRTWSSYESGQSSPKMELILTLAEKGFKIKGITTSSIEDWPEDKIQEAQRRQNIINTGVFPPEMPIDNAVRIIEAVDAHPSPVKLMNKVIPIYSPNDIEINEKSFVIPLLDQKLSAGKGQELPDSDDVSVLIPVPSRLAKYGKNLAALTVEGDSMYPTLDRGDMVVCDSCGWSGEGVYALRMSGEGFVKRLSKAPGKIVIISDNPKYPVREEPEGSQDFEIIGRVHCAIKSMV